MPDVARMFARLQPLVLCGLAFAVALAAQGQLPSERGEAAMLYLLAIALFLTGAWGVMPRQPLRVPDVAAAGGPLRELVPVVAITAPICAVVLLLFHLERWPWFLDVLWVVSIAIALFGAWRLDRGRAPETEAAPWSGLETAAMAVVICAAVALRVWQVPDLPPVFEDEGHGLRDAHRILDGIVTTPFTNGHSSTGTIFEFFIAGLILVGVPGEIALKLAGIVPGVLVVLVLYLLLREWFGWQAALIGAALAATSSWQLMITRWGHVYGFDELFTVSALYFMVRGVRTLQRLDFALAGLAFGLGIVLSKSASTAPLMLLAFFAVLAWSFRRRAIDLFGQHVVLMLLLIALVAAPRVLFVAKDPDTALDRPREVFLYNTDKWPELKRHPVDQTLRNAKELALAFNVDGGYLTRWNVNPDEATLDAITAALLVLGVAFALLRARDWRYFLFLALAAAVLLPAATAIPLDDRPVTYRLAGAMPVVYGLAGVAAYALYESQRLRVTKVAAGAGVCALVLVSAWMNFDDYFNKWAENTNVWYVTGQVDTLVGRHVKDLGDDYDIWVTEHTVYHGTIEGVAWGTPYRRMGKPEDVAALPVATDRPLAFILVEPNRRFGQSRSADFLDAISKRFPGGRVVPGALDPEGKPVYTTYYVDRPRSAATP